MAQFRLLFSLLSLTLPPLFISGVSSGTFTLLNNCDYPVWPGILSNAGISQLSTTGFVLQTGQSKSVNTPSNWGGRMWGRTHCAQNQSTGEFSCVTGDCGTGKLECAGNNALPPATLFEITLDGYGGLSFYDVSLVDGYNLPMLVVPQGATGDNCSNTGCAADLNGLCPSELSVTDSEGDGVVACKSACEKFGSSEYCCSGAYATPNTCKPSSYSELFKRACPLAYSYAYDDKTSTFTCAGADYLITFCPSPSTRGVMASSSSSGTPSPLRIRLCNHGKEAVVHTSWTDKNPGRRFFGCPLWVPGAPKRNGPHCNYFDWLDGEVDDDEKVERRVQRDTRSLNERIKEYERMMVVYESKMEESEFKCKEQEMKCKEYEKKMKEFERTINELEAKVWKTTGMMWGAWVACSILVVIIFAIISSGRGFQKKSLGWRR